MRCRGIEWLQRGFGRDTRVSAVGGGGRLLGDNEKPKVDWLLFVYWLCIRMYIMYMNMWRYYLLAFFRGFWTLRVVLSWSLGTFFFLCKKKKIPIPPKKLLRTCRLTVLHTDDGEDLNLFQGPCFFCYYLLKLSQINTFG